MAVEDPGGSRKGGNPLAGLLGGLNDVLERLNQLAQGGGQEFSRTGELDFRMPGEGRQPMKGVYGFSVKMGLGGEGPRVEPFGNIRRDEETGASVVEDAREPLVDLFDEGDHALILAELPGVDAGDLRVDLAGRTVSLFAERGERRYRKLIELPWEVRESPPEVTCTNGIVEIRVLRRGGE